MGQDKSKADRSGLDARNTRIRAMAAAGIPQGKIADEVGLNRQSVNRILNSEESRKLNNEADSRLRLSLNEAVQTLVDAMEKRHEDMGSGLKAAIALLKGMGVLTEKVELHAPPKPTIIKLIGEDALIVIGSFNQEE